MERIEDGPILNRIGGLVALLFGGAVGTLLRYGLSVGLYTATRQAVFPYATLLVNVSGCLFIGFLAEYFELHVQASPALRIALISGLLGGFTTFSSFAYETYGLVRDGEWLSALVNLQASLILGLGAVWLGVRLARLLW